MKAEILTPWIGTGASTEDANRPLVADQHTIQSWTDVTAQPAENLTPDPNLYSILAEIDQDTLTAIRLDNDFWVLWTDG